MNTHYAEADTLRNGDLASIAQMLKEQRTRALDVVAPASQITAFGGELLVAGTEAHIDEDGVTPTAGTYRLTASAESQIANSLGIPVEYTRRMRRDALDLWDANVNGWLAGYEPSTGSRRAAEWDYPARSGDDRKFLLRMLRGDDGGKGIVRAVLSDRYKVIDNLDVLLATLDGVRESGVDVAIDGCDLSERNMYVRIAAPAVAAMAPELVKGYRSPFNHGATRAGGGFGYGIPAGEEPVVFAGFVISNSETGHGSFSITPRLVVQICKNGLTVNVDAMRNVHLGGRLEEGVIKWSADTQRKSLELVQAKTRDAVKQFLDQDYVSKTVERLEVQAGAPVKDAAETVQIVSKQLKFSEAQSKSILDHFILGGQLTAGGIMQAVSSAAQTLDDADAAAEMEAQAIPALALAAAAAR